MNYAAQKAAAENPRLLAIAAVGEVLDERVNLSGGTALKGEERGRHLAFARHLAYGMLRWMTALEWLASELLRKPPKPRDRDIYRLILLGLFELWQDVNPAHAAVHETAECARLLEKPWAVGLINAVLRRFQREQSDWIAKLQGDDAQHAHPAWLLHAIREDWPEDWPAMVAANNQLPPLWLRVNRRGGSIDDMVESLEDQGFETARHRCAADAIRLEPPAPVQSLTGFDEGWLSVQDPAAQLAVDLLQVENGMRVLDACAAPGGKTCHILERVPSASVTAVELHPERAELIHENLERLRLNCKVLIADATKPEAWWDGKPYARILLDAPCSATGVIRRHPDIRHLRTTAQVGEAVALQSRLLRQLWPLLDPGGILVYATCSVLHEENSRQFEMFLDGCKDAVELAIDAEWGRPQIRGRQILPGEDDMDGFFYAVVRKSS